jgi:fibronectin-binding autotransporter adhesin
MNTIPPKNTIKTSPSRLKRPALLGTLALLCLGPTLLQAANDTWVGNTSPNWGDSNWTGGNNPPLAGDSLFFGLIGSAGTMLNNNIAAGTSFAGLTFNPGASAFTLNGNQIATSAGLVDNSSNLETINLPVALGVASHSLSVVGDGSLLVGGVISDGGSGYGITLPGEGLVTLTNANTYTGATTINAGTLMLDFNDGGVGTNIISDSSALMLGGGTLKINGGTSVFSSQTFASLAVNAGLNEITAAPASGTNDLPDISFNALSGTLGGVVEFFGPVTSSDTNIPEASIIEATATNNTTSAGAGGVGLIGGNGTTTGDYATVGLYDWAATVGDPVSGNDIVGGSQVPGFYTEFGTGNSTLAGNVDFSSASAGSHNTDSMGSMRFNQPGGFVWSPGSVVTTGGMLVTPNEGTNNVYIDGTAGEIEPSRGGASATVVWQNNIQGYLIFNVNNYYNNAKSGAGTLVLAGLGAVEINYPGTFTGSTIIDGSVIAYIGSSSTGVAAGDAALGAAATAATAVLNGGTIMGGANFAMDNLGANPRPISLGNNGGALAAAAGTTMTVDGVVSGSTLLTIGIPASVNNGNVAGLLTGSASGTNTPVHATGTVALTGVNTATGGTVIDTGTLQAGTTTALPTGGLTFNGGNFRWTGTAPDISVQTVTISAPATLDVNGHTVTLAGSIGNGGSGSVTVANSGSPGTGGLFLNGGISYTGGTTVASGAVLGGTGTIAGAVTWNSGSYAALSATSLLTISGTATLTGSTVQVVGSGLTTGVYTLLTATSIAGGSTVNATPVGGAVANGFAGTVSISGNSVILTVTQSGVAATWTDALGNQLWNAGGNWAGGLAPGNPGDAATFGTGGVGAPVSLNQNETVGGLTFDNASSYTVSGASTLTLDNSGHAVAISVTAGTANAVNTPVSLNGNVTTTVGAGDSLAFGGSIANETSAETLTVAGGGTEVLSAANTYGPAAGTVGTTVSGSTVTVGNSAALGAGDVSVTGTSTLQSSGAGVSLPNNIAIASLGALSVAGNAATLGGVISGNGALSAGSAGLALGANNTYVGGTTLNAGTLSIAGDGATAGGAGSLGVVPATATPNNLVINGGDLLGATTLTLNVNRGIGIGASSGLNTATTTALFDAAAGRSFTIAGTIASAGNLGENNVTINSEAGSTGTVALGGANTFNGTNVIDAGTELLVNALALQDSSLLYNMQGGKLDFDTLTNATLGALIGAENLTLTNDSAAPLALTLGNNNSGLALYTGVLGDAGLGGSLTINGPGSQQIGSGSIGAAIYTGGTTLNAGTLILGGHTTLTGALGLTGLNGNCSLTVQDSTVIYATNTLYLANVAGLAYPGVCTLTMLDGADVTAPAFSFGDTSRVPAGCFLTLAGTGGLTIAGGFELEDAEGTTVQNNVVNLDSGVLTAGYFTLTYATAGTHQATFNFDGGVLRANASDGINTSSSGTQFLPALTALTINVTNAVEAAFIDSSNYYVTVAAPLTDSLADDAGLVKQGSGTLILSGANSYTGPTTVSNGTLLVSGSLNNSSENFTVNDGQSFGAYFDGSDTAYIGNITLGNHSGPTALVFTNLASMSSSAFNAQDVALNGSVTIQVQDAVNLTSPGEYPLFTYAALATNSGPGFSLSLPRGLHASLTNDPSLSAIALVVTGYTPPPPSFNGVTVSGVDLVLSATGGTPGDPVTVLSSTDLALPLARWTTVTTGNYDGNGDFNYTVTGATSSGLPQQFYILQGQ